MEDPYQVLGVPKTATLAEIKKAYRAIAKKYHPDLNPGNKEAEKKFKSASHAFDLIGTTEARGKFDRGETDQQQQQQYDEYMKGQRGRRSYYNTQQDTGRYSSQFGEDFDMDGIFEQLFGKQKARAKGDETYHLDIDFKEAALGAEKVLTLPHGKKLEVKIPAGIEEGKKLKLKGGGVSGDAIVQIGIRPLAGFKREGLDILTEVPVSFFEAIKGAEVEVPTLEGVVLMKIPSGATTGSRLRIKHKGAGAGEQRGNLLVTLKIVMPKHVDPELKRTIEALDEKFHYNPRTV